MKVKTTYLLESLSEKYGDDGEGLENTATKNTLAQTADAILQRITSNEGDFDMNFVDWVRHFTANDNLYHMSNKRCSDVLAQLREVGKAYETWTRARKSFLSAG